jgi:N-(5-amino-5-carboxypentanoyl)-L-cysteinyl-D-valine synthase
MMSSTSAAPAEGWRGRIDATSGHRCDLDVLLRDEWRHRIVPRDDRPGWAQRQQRIDITGRGYAALRDRLRDDDGVSLGSLALAALHITLDAYGHGTHTVVAYRDGLVDAILPVIVDHTEQARLSSRAAVERIERALSGKEYYASSAELLHQGLFDTVLIRSDADLAATDVPAAPLLLVVHDDADAARLVCTLTYAAELFADTIMAGVLDVLREAFGQLVAYPERLVSDVEFLPAEQRRQLRRWNATAGEFPADKRLNELFEECARRSPDQTAVIFGDRRMTYRQVDERSNQFAHWLVGPGAQVRPRDLVALCLDKSDLGVIATFGIWKAGAAYVPIDPSYPADRIRFTIADTRLSAIVTNRRHAKRLRELAAGQPITVVELEAVLAADGPAADLPRDKPAVDVTSADLAYVTYTSGTTGFPKGVPKDHRSVVNSITDLSRRYDMGHPGTERIALFASYVFEPHLRQTLIALINAQTLVVIPDDVRLDPDLFPGYLAHHGVTYLNATGSVIAHFDLGRCPSLTRLLLVGEELTSAGLRRLREHFAGRIINEYAFTESAFVTAIKEFPPGVTTRTDRSIGRPLRNVTWYVLSQNRKELPIGAIGELYIGGSGIAPGYLNQDDLNADAFFTNPFASDEERASGANTRLYRTGDLARMLPTGEVEFLGRADFQLKINGIRIEPGEIEARASEYPGVHSCVVIARQAASGTDDRYLVGYYVTRAGASVAEADLLAYLQECLIPVMVPARMIRLDRFPVNVNGKVDWRTLPDPGQCDSAGHRTPTTIGDGDDILTALRGICGAVLGVAVDRIRADDDFFRLGGQSISCILLIARIRQQLRRRIAVSDVFRLRTLQALADYLSAHAPRDADAEGHTDADNRAQYLLANGLQQGLLYHAMKSADGDDAYVVQSVYRYHCLIDPDLMRLAWRYAQRRYPSLRLRFEPGVSSRQVIADDEPLDWRLIDLSHISDRADQAARIEAIAERDRAERYRPTDGNLMRVYLIRQAEQRFTLVFSCHHIVIDGWSLPVLHDEVHRMYLDLVAGRAVEPGEDRAYVAAQRYWQEHRDDHVEYWTSQIERIDERGDLSGLLNPHSRYKLSLRDYDHVREHRTQQLRLGAELTARLAAACHANDLTLHSVVQFVWHRALYAFGGGRMTVVGTIVSGRNIPVDGIEHSVGLYINTLPLVVDHAQQSPRSVAEAVAEIQSLVHAMNDRSVVELGRLASGGMKRQMFDTLLVLENYPRLLDEAEERRHRTMLRYERFFDADRVDHPMAVVAREEGDELTLNLWFAGELFSGAAIEALLDTTRVLFEQVAADMTGTVGELELVSPAMAQALDAFNRTEREYPAGKTLHAVFEQAAATWPDEPAVTYRDTTLTYADLNERANRLAHHLLAQAQLRAAPLHADDLIALVLDKTELMAIAIIAAWKTGAAYVPIDAENPDDRIRYLLADTGCRVVLTNRRYAERLRGLVAEAEPPVLALEELDLSAAPVENPVTATTSTDLAYAIYTSGTTGRPKAVLVEHCGVINLQTSMARLFGLDKRKTDEAVLSFSNYVFDHFVEQFTDALLNGQKLVILDDTMRTDETRLCQYINEHQVTYLSGTPSVLSLYDYSSTSTLRRIDAIGEDLTEPVFDKIRSTFPGVVINGYGPTEISITSHKRVYPPGERRRDKSIGLPVANTTCYVVNSTMKRVPVGGIGELYIGGDGVARGYLNRPDLTAQRFLDNPFRTAQEEQDGRNARIYRTGDLARWLPNGELEYLGRTDLQVKIRGQRVELGEIEAVLATCPGVTRALVIAREHAPTAATAAAQKYLVGFYLGDPTLTEQDVLAWMRGKLAEALVPARVLRIDDLPVTPSGKLDVKLLPATDFAPASAVAYTPPTSDVEIGICRIWADVLDIAPDSIGVNDDFFSRGGDSIRAMALAQAMTRAFGRDVGVAAVFGNVTIAALARYVEDAVDAYPVTGLAGSNASAPPVSLAQERLLFIDEFEGGTSAYNVPFCLRLAGVPAQAAVHAVGALVDRHAVLRTLLRADAGGVRRQYVLSPADASARLDLPVRAVDTLSELDEVLLAGERHVFALGQELPIRGAVVTVAACPGDLYLSLVFHHTCIDGWSWDVLRGELHALLDGERLPTVRGTYADFAVWQRQSLTGGSPSPLLDWWSRHLEGAEPIRLPADWPRPARFDYRGREVPFRLDEPTTGALRALARSARVSLYSVLLAGWCLMLRGFTGQDDLVVGTPFANRGRPEFARVVGFLANLLAVRVRLDQAATVTQYLQAVGAAVVAAQVHADMPFEQLVKELAVEADPSRHPVVQVNFTLQPGGDPATIEYRSDPATPTSVKFDLSALLYESADGVAGTVTYSESLFEPSTVDGFLAAYHHVLAQFARLTPETTRLADLTWVDEAVAAADGSAGRWSTGDPIPAGTLHELFERVAARQPDEVAIACGGRRLIYRELNERSNQLAHRLRATVPLGRDNLVALVMEKTELTVVALLAVWKAGAAYVPIDPGYPDERIAFMLGDTGARLVVADEAYVQRLRRLADGSAPVLAVEDPAPDERNRDNLAVPVGPDDLAYAIYTSGTTGRPKAVLVRHRNAISFYTSLQGRYFDPDAQPRQGIALLANYVFDFSVEQILMSVISGHKLILLPPTSDPDHDAYANREGLTFLSGTPTQFLHLDLSELTGLCGVLVAGELFAPHHFDKIRREYAGPLFNAYGTTETTVYNTVRRFEPGDPYRNDLGRPLPNTRRYVLDDALRPLPVGAIGELYLAGECVSAGYLNRPQLTAERFLPNHLEGGAGQLYKTGDVVRLRADGELCYLGRNDTQVKIRGLRIELGEVEAAIAACPGVRQCAVLAREGGLVGFYVPEPGADIDDDAIMATLRDRLARNMLPSVLVRLEGPLPMTIGGKLDTDALPPVEFGVRRAAYAAPRSRVDTQLCRLWSDLLPVAGVGIDDDFFRTGGDSISALHLASRVQRDTGYPVSVKDLFDHPTVRALVDNVLSRQLPAEAGHVVPDDVPPGTECPMLPIQRWFFAKPLADRSRYSQNFAIHTPQLDVSALRSAVERLVARHDAFRLRYRDDGAAVSQFYAAGHPRVELHHLNVAGLRDEEIAERLARWRAGFDLAHGPMFAVAYLDGFGDGSARVWLALHHLVVDVVSWQILADDLEILYHGGELGRTGSTYRQWVRATRRYTSVDGEAQLWAQLASAVATEPAGPPAGPVARRRELTLSDADTAALLTESGWAYETEIDDLLLTAVGYALAAVTGRTSNHVTVEGHGREPFAGAPDVRHTMGWFTTMYPVALQAHPEPGQALLATRASRRRIPHHGLGYGLLRGAYGGPGAPLPPVSVNYLGRLRGGDTSGGDAGDTRWRLETPVWADNTIVGGEQASGSAVDVTISVVDGRLATVIDSRWDAPVTERFASELDSRLAELIAHTSAVARTGRAASRPRQPHNDFIPFIPVNGHSTGRTLFVLPPGEGGAESYLNNIARVLTGCRLILFNNLHLHTPHETFEELAGYYLEHLRRVQPAGPYSLLGWSFGGVLAVEMARQLALTGERVEHLMLIDPYFNVRHALAQAGLEHVTEDLLDPINYRYAPSRADLDMLGAAIGETVLFKAGEPNQITTGQTQHRFFESYRRSDYNHLDSLLPGARIRVVPLPGRTHHDWVLDQRTVANMSRIVAALLADPQPRHPSTPERS